MFLGLRRHGSANQRPADGGLDFYGTLVLVAFQLQGQGQLLTGNSPESVGEWQRLFLGVLPGLQLKHDPALADKCINPIPVARAAMADVFLHLQRVGAVSRKLVAQDHGLGDICSTGLNGFAGGILQFKDDVGRRSLSSGVGTKLHPLILGAGKPVMIPCAGFFNVTKQGLPQFESRSLSSLIVGFLFGHCVGRQKPIRPQLETADPHAVRLAAAILHIAQLQQISSSVPRLVHERRIAAAHIIVIRVIHLTPVGIKQPDHRIACGRQTLGIHLDGEPFPRLGVQCEPVRRLPRQGAVHRHRPGQCLRFGAIGTGRSYILQRIHQHQPGDANALGIVHAHHAHMNRRVCRYGHTKHRLFALGLDQFGLRRKTRPEFQVPRQSIAVHTDFHRLPGRPSRGLHGVQGRQGHCAHDAQKGK